MLATQVQFWRIRYFGLPPPPPPLHPTPVVPEVTHDYQPRVDKLFPHVINQLHFRSGIRILYLRGWRLSPWRHLATGDPPHSIPLLFITTLFHFSFFLKVLLPIYVTFTFKQLTETQYFEFFVKLYTMKCAVHVSCAQFVLTEPLSPVF